MKKYFYLILSLFFLIVQCKKTEQNLPIDYELPPATTQGTDKIGCLVNGKAWIPKPFLCVACTNFLDIKISKQRDEFKLYTTNYNFEKKIDQSISIEVKSPRLGNNIIMPNSLNFYDANIYRDLNILAGFYDLDTTQPRNLILTRIDSTNRIISGTFEFVAIDKKLKDTVRITHGRFDGGKYTTAFY